MRKIVSTAAFVTAALVGSAEAEQPTLSATLETCQLLSETVANSQLRQAQILHDMTRRLSEWGYEEQIDIVAEIISHIHQGIVNAYQDQCDEGSPEPETAE